MNKKIISVLVLVLVILMSCMSIFAAGSDMDNKSEKEAIIVKSAELDIEKEELTITFANTTAQDMDANIMISFDNKDAMFIMQDNRETASLGGNISIDAGKEWVINSDIKIGKSIEEMPVLSVSGEYQLMSDIVNVSKSSQTGEFNYIDILNEKGASKASAIISFLKQTGFSITSWQQVVMIIIACVLLYLAIVKKFEPLLLLPIAFGMLLTNLAGAEMFHEELFSEGHVHWELFGATNHITPGLIDILYLGVKLGIYPCLIFVGVGAMTDFGPLIANPKSLLLGAAAQVGIFATFLGARALGFTPAEAGSIGIIGGADGPTAIFVTTKLAPHLLGPIAVAAYSYMALVPVIQPPIMKLLTTKKERQIEMKALREVSKTEKIIFPIVVTVFVALLVPSAGALVGCLMLGNLLKESGVCERLSKTVQNELMNIVTVFLGISVGATATAQTFLSLETIKIIVMGVVAFGVATACGVLLAKFMNLFLKNKINPLIGSAGVSAVPMAARVSQKVGQEENPSNFLLMHAMGPNVAGVIGSAIAAGALIAMIAK